MDQAVKQYDDAEQKIDNKKYDVDVIQKNLAGIVQGQKRLISERHAAQFARKPEDLNCQEYSGRKVNRDDGLQLALHQFFLNREIQAEMQKSGWQEQKRGLIDPIDKKIEKVELVGITEQVQDK